MVILTEEIVNGKLPFLCSDNKEIDEGYLLKVDVQYTENYINLIMTYHFYLKKRKLKKLCKKAFEKLVTNLHDKANYVILVIHIRKLKQALNNKLVSEKVDRVIKFNRNTWLKPYIDMNTDLRKKAKNDFEKDFYKLMLMRFLEKL